ncbi:Transposase DDE domain protein [Rubripirellula obstinata]|uniref:Transposase DDE domain protein n=1 Tax=Rubripirellula obstinata TaxID=406547 RepID=A0A5B1CG62_9BACT|nr:IS1182 family transposase [Rubripirellula obstinata]KAA1257589.1 Transposase DDE domain protein [Rubripirellula obstinata]KAA1259093.1 Transposase DDE domain protein [Rubripirellula obstinata]KAA1259191.1 Transposase DDE domain protein [Rubripirellula obstinata]KAA1262540.1 Transposase DDE domain protein [Rubripirellula obstinata]
MRWDQPALCRDQQVLFPEKLDQIIPADHRVRQIDWILRQIDWSDWEQLYKPNDAGRPPIHPRVLASVILYGLLCRIRASRKLEEALSVRNDFRWLVEGRSIDHTTLSSFRTAHPKLLKGMFVKVGLLAKEMQLSAFKMFGYDATRVRASNRRTGTRSLEELKEAKKQLQEQFEQEQKKADQEQTAEDQLHADDSGSKGTLEDLKKKSEQIDAALKRYEQLEQEGKTKPARLPITDTDARVSKNKEGGYGINHTPANVVDQESGLVVDSDVIDGVNENGSMIGAVNQARENLEIEGEAVQVLADGLMDTPANIVGCPENEMELFTPAGPSNPAFRDDPSEPVAEEDIDRLPTRKRDGKKYFDKSAFVYDSEANAFHCPQGKVLEHASSRTDHTGQPRDTYRASASVCNGCPLRDRCFQSKGNKSGRRIECGSEEKAVQDHRQKMQTEEAKVVYAKRAAATERPFAVIKHVFGLRQFLTRGFERVRQEWDWANVAFNLTILERHLGSGCGFP